MTTLFLVKGDTGPQVKLTGSRQDTGTAVDCRGTPIMRVRRRGSTTVSFTLTATDVGSNRQDGILIFPFGNNLLNLDPGQYEGEVQVTFSDGSVESIFERIDFVVRDQFA